MKHIKSIVSLLLTLTLALSLTACGSQANTEPEQPDDTPTTAEVNLYVLSGPTGIGAMNARPHKGNLRHFSVPPVKRYFVVVLLISG